MVCSRRVSALFFLLAAYGCGDDAPNDVGSNDAAPLDVLLVDVTGSDAPGDTGFDVPLDTVLAMDAGQDGTELMDVADVGPVDVGTDAPVLSPSRCDEFPGVYLCDGFESEPGPWTNFTTTQASDSPLYRGLFSRRAFFEETVNFNGNSTVFWDSNDPIPAPESFYFRAYVRVDGSLEHRSLALLRLEAAPSVYFLFVGDPSATRFVDGIGGGGSLSGEGFPRNRWVCMQLSVQGANIRVLADGAELVSGTMDAAAMEYSALSLGLMQLPGGGPVTPDISVSMDEVVLADSPVPCD